MLPEFADSLAVASSSFAHGAIAGLALGLVFGGVLVLAIGAVLMAGRTDALGESVGGHQNPEKRGPALEHVELFLVRFKRPEVHRQRAGHAHEN